MAFQDLQNNNHDAEINKTRPVLLDIGDVAAAGAGAASVVNSKNHDDIRQDEANLAILGKKQQLQRNFGFWSMIGFAASMTCTWEAELFANATALENGGGPTLVYGTLFAWVGSLVTAASLAEMASAFPTSGGQYHFTYILAPARTRVFLSWFTGWIATIGWIADIAAGVYFGGSVIQGLVILNYPDYVPERWQATLLMYACLVLVVTVNTIGARFLPHIEHTVLVLHTLGFLAVLIPLVALAPKSSDAFVWRTFDASAAGWNSDGTAWFVGLISANLPFVGYDGPLHMAEEVNNAVVNVPRAMIATIILNGATGFAMVVAFLCCIGNVDSALAPATGYDFIGSFYQATNSLAGASVMVAIPNALVICATFCMLASASRQTWAFARDRGMPCSDFLAHVDPRTKLPLRSIALCTVVTALICLINIGSTVAFNAIVSVTIAGLFTSYLIPICLLITKRIRGETYPENEGIRFGPWRMGHTVGLVTNTLSAVYLFISIVFSFFPPATPVVPLSMNWSIVVWGGVVLLGLFWYGVRGVKQYHGPIVESILASAVEELKMSGA